MIKEDRYWKRDRGLDRALNGVREKDRQRWIQI